jgi:hypothetical protein
MTGSLWISASMPKSQIIPLTKGEKIGTWAISNELI